MCDECGCNSTRKVIIDKSITDTNDKLAHTIWHNLKDQKILCINLMGAPGSGKTTVIEQLSKLMDPKGIFIIQGDLESDIDKVRLEKKDIDAYQINTHSGCHLNAQMIKKALSNIKLENKKYLIIENVGNLVCPAGIKIGQHIDIVVSSTTEGSDKPKKYPHIFMDASLAIISKTDIASNVCFNEDQYLNDIKKINGKIKIIKTSSKDNKSFLDVSKFIKHKRDHLLEIKHNH
jgi:hydrogenase nickel incorporation protein HypB